MPYRPSDKLPSCQPLRVLDDGTLEAFAPAKLNLILHVGPRGADGYHPLDSVVTKVDWCDRLIFRLTNDGRVELQCDAAQTGPLQDNLVMRAARALLPRASGQGARIVLHKYIAVGAGLGGGSSDAASTLLALNELWRLGVPREELASIGATLGADVPLFLGPPAARMTGRGEAVQPVDIGPFWALLVCPPVHAATAEVYRAYDRSPLRGLDPVDIAPLRDRPVAKWDAFLRNDLLKPACLLYPQIPAWIDRVTQATGRPAHMTGSGSALFVPADDEPQARHLLARLDKEQAAHARIVRSWAVASPE